MGCNASRIEPSEAIVINIQQPCSSDSDQQSSTTIVKSSTGADNAADEKSSAMASGDSAATLPSIRSLQIYTSASLITKPAVTQFSPRTQALMLHQPPAPDSVPRRSILKAPGTVKKDWDAIRAKKGMLSPSGAVTGANTDSISPKSKNRETDFTDTIIVIQQPQHSEEKINAATLIESNNNTNSNASNDVDEVITIHHQKLPSQDSTNDPFKAGTSPSASPTHANTAPTANNITFHSSNNGSSDNTNNNSAVNSRQNSLRSKKKKRRTSHKGLMSRLALQFPVIRRSFIVVYQAYYQYMQQQQQPSTMIGGDVESQTLTVPTTGEPSPSSSMSARTFSQSQLLPSLSSLGNIDVSQLKSVLEHLTNHTRTFSDDTVNELFALSHLNHSKQALSFREVLIAIALGYYLADDNHADNDRDPNYARIRQGFKVIQQAFHDMDDDSSGKLDREEMKNALFAASSMSVKNHLLEARFAELDFNSDGDVELKEFIYGVVSWVNLTAEEEIDEMEQQA